ncbi:hypothetical protein J1605_018507 [Eschrichtius robustus]|uniref:Uncharacterized protein n=1 Tax=Eschrichtius robustus TaxID=9764 RepID=A0AB34HQP0_ESCRO|nr:hypothetical protein J1605_018507 [Eschrichtius robustus]
MLGLVGRRPLLPAGGQRRSWRLEAWDSVLGAGPGVSCVPATVARSSWLSTGTLPNQWALLRRPLLPSPKAEDSDVLLPLLLLFGAFSQEAGVTRGS